MANSISKWVRLRIILVGLGLAGLALLVCGRFFQLQVIRGSELREEATKEIQKFCPILPVRGQILDRRGTELAVSTRVYSVVAHPGQIKNASRLSRQLAPILGFKTGDLTEILTRPKPFVWVKRHLTPEKEEAFRTWQAEVEKPSPAKIPATRRDEDAVYLIPESRRYYPQLAMAGPVLGFCNVDGQGLEGLEVQYDNYLYGKPKKCTKLLDARGHIVVDGEKAEDPEVMGNNLTLSLDRTVQYIAEKELAQGVAHWHAAGGMVTVVRPQTGEVLAMAQTPGMDPNRYSQYPEVTRKNRLLTDAFEPGSTFKIFIIASALDAQVVKPTDKFHCENGVYYLGSKEVIHDVHPYGTLEVWQIIQKSSNIGATKVSFKAGPKRLDYYLAAFGFGRRTGILFPGESPGLVKNLAHARSPLDRATVAFGQGVSITPLQLTMALAAMGNDGVLMEPLLVKEVVSPEGEIVKQFQPRPVRRVLSQQTARQMLSIMATVTQAGGTATAAAPPGFTVAGKTGTAQKLVSHAYSHSKFNAIFVGLVPADNPVLAISVVIDEPKGAIFGGVVAAPIFREIAAQALPYLGYYPKTENAPVLASILPTAAAAQAPPTEPKAHPPHSLAPTEPLKVMPDVRGLTIRQVIDLLHKSGLHFRFQGSGLAAGQDPAPGSPISPGDTCAVKFRSPS